MKYLGAVICLVFLFTSCSSMSVHTDFDQEIDFAKYKTFQWKPAPLKAGKNPFAHDGLMDKRVRQAIESDLVAKEGTQQSIPFGKTIF